MAELSFKTIATNRRAYHDFAFDEKIECGIELVGSEVKSMRAGHVAFADSYARVRSGELWLVGLNISPYSHSNLFNHETDRERRLLIHKAELRRFKRRIDERGFTLVPTKIYLKGGLVKIELGLGRGKREFDKRQSIKSRDQGRDAAREARERFG